MIPGARLGFTVFLQAPLPCGATFQFSVSSTGGVPYSSLGDAVRSGSCAVPKALAAAHVRRVSSRVVAVVPAMWSEAPAAVSYAWQRCTGHRCVAVRGAGGLRLKVSEHESVRIVETATFSGGTQLRSVSKMFAA